MTKVKGSTILSHLTQINNTDESEMHAYIVRLISVSLLFALHHIRVTNRKERNLNVFYFIFFCKQTFKPDDNATKLSKTTSSSSRTKVMNQQLSEIFTKIASKHQAQEVNSQLKIIILHIFCCVCPG